MHRVSIDQAKSTLPDLIEAAVGGDDVLIAKDDKHIVRLVPVSGTKPVPQFGSAKGLIIMAEDFDAPIKDFDEYAE
ncbi:MAG: Antitoxin component of toxin-antitoxin stability system, DNA-binding transcriptional repressor [Acidobacteria bacterium]|nr:Antitoxin component of toxin-antitoxin stability system, DNA-binding transcriptional repressor [Acidobacteriota bacterium]